MMKLLLVRHGDTGPDYRGRYIGTSDVPLWSGSISQVKELAPLIMNYKPRQCFVSPLARVRQTADFLVEKKQVEICLDDELREVAFGSWEGCSFDEIVRKDPERVNQWAAGKDDFCFPAGDSIGQFRQRVRDRADYYTSLDADTVLLVSHGGVIRTMICHLLGLSFEKYLSFVVKPAALTVLESFEPGTAVMTGFNLTCQRS